MFMFGAVSTAVGGLVVTFIKSKWTDSRRIASRIPQELKTVGYAKELYVAGEFSARYLSYPLLSFLPLSLTHTLLYLSPSLPLLLSLSLLIVLVTL
jgi:hypothetical protein